MCHRQILSELRIGTLVALVLLAASCSSTSEVANVATPGDAPAAATQPGDVQLGFLDDPIQMQRPLRQASLLIEALGGEAQAIDALLFAFEAGYSGSQIDAAITASTLAADGTISGVAPAGPPLGRIAPPGGASRGNRLGTKPTKQPVHQRQTDDNDKLLVDRLRGSAIEHGAAGAETVTGFNGVSLIIALLDKGFMPEQIIEIIILGEFFHESPPGYCYSQRLPIRDHPPVARPCDGEGERESNDPSDTAPADTSSTEESATDVASYRGDLGAGFAESQLVMTIAPDGTVTGQLTAVEELDNFIVSIDFGCGLLDEDEDCSGAVVECPATSNWSADFSTLTFTGEAPDRGTLSGQTVVTFFTVPDGCGDPVTETQSLDVAATVAPDGIDVTAPIQLRAERVTG